MTFHYRAAEKRGKKQGLTIKGKSERLYYIVNVTVQGRPELLFFPTEDFPHCEKPDGASCWDLFTVTPYVGSVDIHFSLVVQKKRCKKKKNAHAPGLGILYKH